MEHLIPFSIFIGCFFGGFGLFMLSIGLLWWVSLYKQVHLGKEKQ